jgi:D-arabinose 1-dehydrogenase-like Zn-dependent alcohol dehydrogenase
MKTMLAARLVKPGEPLRLEEVPVPEPAPDEILVKVSACGLCGTDLHLAVAGDIPVERTPITLGHEGAGVVAAAGREARSLREGGRVVLFPAAYCGACRFCLQGRHSLCDRSRVYGMARDGALAEYVVAPERAAIRLPDAVPFEIGAIVTDGVATPFHALRSRGRLRAGETVAVFGCGGLGTHAVMLARLMGAARIAAVDVDEKALARVRALGADLALDMRQGDPAKAIRAAFGRGADLALEFVGLPETAEAAIRSLDKAGRAVLVGVGAGRAALPPLVAFVGREQSVLGSFGMDRADIEDLLALVAAGRLDLSASVSARYPLSEANAALQRLASKRDGVVRIVVVLDDGQ